MRYVAFIYLFLLQGITTHIVAQSGRSDKYVSVGIQLNGMTYVGELSSPNGEFKDYSAITRPGVGLFLSKRLLPRLTLTTSFNYGRIYGDDNLVANPTKASEVGSYARNLHFRNDIFEGTIAGEWSIFPLSGHFSKRKLFSPYVFGGLTILRHNPEAKAPDRFGGTWIALRDIGTEGQNIGLAEKYSRTQLAFTSGFGVNYRVSDRIDIGLRFGYRQTTTDYLDDVSGRYLDLGVFGGNELARSMSDRSIEPFSVSTGDLRNIDQLGLRRYTYTSIDGNTYETINGFYNGTSGFGESNLKRGNNQVKDGYWISSIRLGIIISDTKKEEVLSKVYRIDVPPIRERDEPIRDDFLQHRDKYEVVPLMNLNTKYSEIPTGFYKEGILIDSDRPEKANESGRMKGDFFSIYYAPFTDMNKTKLISPVIFAGDIYGKHNRISAAQIGNKEVAILAMFEDLSKSKSEKFQSIYTAHITGENIWTDVERIPFNNMGYSMTHPSVTTDGQTMYLVSDMPGGYGGTDIYVSYLFKGQWTLPRNLGPAVNTSGDEVYPFVHPDGTLYFASDGHEGIGGLDIFEAIAVGDEFVEVINVGSPINSAFDDFCLILDDVKRTGYFSSNRLGGLGSNDVYQLQVKALSKNSLLTETKDLEEVKEVRIKGVVLDSITRKPISGAFVRLNNTVTGQLDVTKTNKQGQFFYDVTTAGQYEIASSALGYKTMQMQSITAINRHYDVNEVEITLPLKPNDIKLMVAGTILSKETETPMTGLRVRLTKISDGSVKIFESNLAGRYVFQLEREQEYTLEVSGDEVVKSIKTVSTRNKSRSQTILVNFSMRKR